MASPGGPPSSKSYRPSTLLTRSGWDSTPGHHFERLARRPFAKPGDATGCPTPFATRKRWEASPAILIERFRAQGVFRGHRPKRRDHSPYSQGQLSRLLAEKCAFLPKERRFPRSAGILRGCPDPFDAASLDWRLRRAHAQYVAKVHGGFSRRLVRACSLQAISMGFGKKKDRPFKNFARVHGAVRWGAKD